MIINIMNIDNLVRNALYSLIREQANEQKSDKEAEKKQPQAGGQKQKKRKKSKAPAGSINIAPGSVGRGRFKGFVAEAGARAESDPDGLMEDLGVKSAGGNTDADRVKGVLQRAIAFNDLMSQAYGGASGARVKIGEGEQVTTGVRVALGELSTRDGIKFISHTLAGAKNAGMLSLDGAIEIGLHDGEIFIKSI